MLEEEECLQETVDRTMKSVDHESPVKGVQRTYGDPSRDYAADGGQETGKYMADVSHEPPYNAPESSL